MPPKRQATPRPGSRDSGQGNLPRLGYLLKHAQLRYRETTSAAFAPLGIRPQEWAALNCMDEEHGRSQKEVAELLGVDRTTMVALVDELESKGLVARRPQDGDRRKNTVTLTTRGRKMMQRGAQVADDCERDFLAALDESETEQFKRALLTVIATSR